MTLGSGTTLSDGTASHDDLLQRPPPATEAGGAAGEAVGDAEVRRVLRVGLDAAAAAPERVALPAGRSARGGGLLRRHGRAAARVQRSLQRVTAHRRQHLARLQRIKAPLHRVTLVDRRGCCGASNRQMVPGRWMADRDPWVGTAGTRYTSCIDYGRSAVRPAPSQGSQNILRRSLLRVACTGRRKSWGEGAAGRPPGVRWPGARGLAGAPGAT